MELNWLNRLLKKLTPTHVFILALAVIILANGGSWATSYFSTEYNKKRDEMLIQRLDEIAWNVSILRSGNNNNLSLSGAKYITEKTLRDSKLMLLSDINNMLKINDITDKSRQTRIILSLDAKINKYYTSDYSSLTRFYYNNKEMSSIWDSFEVDDLSKDLSRVLFDDSYYNRPNGHDLMKEDIKNILDARFDSYKEIAFLTLNKL